MRRIPIDSTRVRFMGTGKVAERAEYVELTDGQRRRSGDQAKDDNGLPQWVVDVLVIDDESDRAEVAAVKIGSHAPPETTLAQEVRFRDLVALPYVQQGTGRVSLSFSASGIDAPAGKPQPANAA